MQKQILIWITNALFFSLNFAMGEVLNWFNIMFRLSVFNNVRIVSYRTLSTRSMQRHWFIQCNTSCILCNAHDIANTTTFLFITAFRHIYKDIEGGNEGGKKRERARYCFFKISSNIDWQKYSPMRNLAMHFQHIIRRHLNSKMQNVKPVARALNKSTSPWFPTWTSAAERDRWANILIIVTLQNSLEHIMQVFNLYFFLS